jgi:hypothetical protein
MQAYDEFSFPAGAIIAVTSAPEDGRWIGWRIDKPETRKSPGVFYRTYVSLLRRVDGSRANGSVLFQGMPTFTFRLYLLVFENPTVLDMRFHYG